jgi:hypothetical protein
MVIRGGDHGFRTYLKLVIARFKKYKPIVTRKATLMSFPLVLHRIQIIASRETAVDITVSTMLGVLNMRDISDCCPNLILEY